MLFLFFTLYSLCVLLLPLRHLRRSNLLPRCVHVADDKVLGDLLHVLIVEEGVEAQLVCRKGEAEDAPTLNMHWLWLRIAPVGTICVQVIHARTSGALPPTPYRPIKCHAALLWLQLGFAGSV